MEITDGQDLGEEDIGQVGLKVQKYPDGDQSYYGLRLKTRDGELIFDKEWSSFGKWEYQSLSADQRLIGFHGNIFCNDSIQQIGVVTLQLIE